MEPFNFKKKYGQNFLVDENIVRKIVDIPVKEKSLVIEIGCGDGRLTKYLCSNFYKVIGYLSKYDYDNLYVIANLPYYITTPILEKIIDLDLDIEMIRVMVQKEVGDRFCASVGTKNYGSLTVYLNYNYDVKKEFIVNRNSFYPRPNVDSIVVSFYKKNRTFVKDLTLFYKLVRDSFRFKRKTLRNNLKEYNLSLIEQVLNSNGYDLSVRAEQLSIDIFCEISNKLSI